MIFSPWFGYVRIVVMMTFNRMDYENYSGLAARNSTP
jgi:hypothetical protein